MQYKSLIPRVSTFNGNSSNIVIVAPHGKDDINTSIVAEEIINELGCYGVINNGWSRNKIDCNNINIKGEAKKEFLDPLVNFVNIITLSSVSYVFIIHGVSDNIRLNAPMLDFIIGNGQGNPPRLSCDLDYTNTFMQLLEDKSYVPYQGKVGGNYSGWHQNNLNQLFYNKTSVVSLQIEIVKSLRNNDLTAKRTGIQLASCINKITTSATLLISKTFPEI